MIKDDATTVIYNYFWDHWDLHQTWTLEYREIPQYPISNCKEFFKTKLGKQTYCIQLADRNWVWEHNNWRAYISSRGFSFEVKEDLTLLQVCEAWQDFFFKMTGKQSKLSVIL